MEPSQSTTFRRTTAIVSTLILALTAAFGPSATTSFAAVPDAKTRVGLTQIRQSMLPSVVSHQAVRLSTRAADSPMTLSIGLPIRNEAALNRFLATEGQSHGSMSHAQFDAEFGASPAHVHQLLGWAKAHGLIATYVSQDGLTVNVTGTTGQVAAAFHTEIANYRLGAQRFYANARKALVPSTLGIQTVLGLNSIRDAHMFAVARRHVVPQCPSFSQGADCYMPKNLRAAYDVSQHGGLATNQSIGFTLWGAPEVQRDFNTFAAATRDPKITICATTSGDSNPAACNNNHGKNSIQFVEFDAKAANKDTSGLGETAMDIEYAHGMAANSHMKYFLGGDGSDPDLAAALSAAENDKSLHLVSSSWGGALPTKSNNTWLVATTKIFKAADAVGTTFLFSTGDDASDSGCIGLAKLCGLPEYPAVSPYVLAVGGTNVQMNAKFNAWTSEMTWDNWQHVDQDSQTGKNVYSVEGGGSGCTTFFGRPVFQKTLPHLAVNASCAGRAIPDVSADGDPNNSGVLVVDGAFGKEEATISAGTSLATPVGAGMMADTLNFEGGKHLKPFWRAKGWLTPQLYALGKSSLYETYFHDAVCGYNGSPADIGWDQATGLGSPDWYAISRGISGISVPKTGKVPAGCHLATTPIKPAENNMAVPQTLWPAGSGTLTIGSQTETWLDKSSFFSQFKSRTYKAAGAAGNIAEEAIVPIGDDTTNPFGLWLGTDYSSSIQADRVLKDTTARAKKKFNLSFDDCSNGYSVEFPLLIPNSDDILTPDCQVLVAPLKDGNGQTWDVVYWIYAVDNTVGEMVFEAPASTVSASSTNGTTFLQDALTLAFAGAGTLNHAADNTDPGPLPATQASPVRSTAIHELEARLGSTPSGILPGHCGLDNIH